MFLAESDTWNGAEVGNAEALVLEWGVFVVGWRFIQRSYVSVKEGFISKGTCGC